MSPISEPEPTGNTPEQIRHAAVRAALILPLVGTACGLFLSRGLIGSFLNSIAATAAGFAAWMVYHRTSGRDDGLALASMPVVLAISMNRESNQPFLTTLIILLTVYLPLAWLMGRWNRGLGKLKGEKIPPDDPDGFAGVIARD